MIYRQGEILLKPIDQFPKGIKKKDLILAYGEATGHCHQFLDSNIIAVYELDSKNPYVYNNQVQEHMDLNQQFVEVFDDAALVHEEHNNIIIPSGKYEVIRQREVDLTNEIRRIMD